MCRTGTWWSWPRITFRPWFSWLTKVVSGWDHIPVFFLFVFLNWLLHLRVIRWVDTLHIWLGLYPSVSLFFQNWFWYFRVIRCVDTLHIWLGPHTSVYLPAATVSVGWRCHPSVTTSLWHPLSDPSLWLVPLWVSTSFVSHMIPQSNQIMCMSWVTAFLMHLIPVGWLGPLIMSTFLFSTSL